MTREKIIEVLDDYNHRGYSDWDSKVVGSEPELSQECSSQGTGEGLLMLDEAYAIVKEYMKRERRDDLIERYLRERKKVIHQTNEFYFRVLPEGSTRRSKTYVIQKKEGEEMVPVKEGLSFKETFDEVVSNIGPFFHYLHDDKGILISEFED